MPTETSISSHDPRDRLVREKYFSLRPKPLERYLWQQGVPQAAERVFWLHWEEGMRNRDWCSEVPLKRVAALCCVDTSTVTRAYQVLKGLGLIRRESAGRDPENPFQQATAITEVRIPRELLTELSRSPNRANVRRLGDAEGRQSGEGALTAQAQPQAPGAAPGASEPVPAASSEPVPTPKLPSRQDIQATWGRASAGERGRFFTASREGKTALEFDADTKLTPEDRGQLLIQLEQLARARYTAPPKATAAEALPGNSAIPTYAKPRRLSVLELARTRKRVGETVPTQATAEVLRQVVWAVEEGALRRFELPLAVNIALKKIREGAWTRPNRMPPNWSRLDARAEACSAA